MTDQPIRNSLRRALLEKKLTLGGWLQIGHPAAAEVFARAGFDWVCVDFEHGAIDIETATNIFRALDAFGCVPVGRLPANDPIWIHRVLDAGARGLIVPMVNTASQARSVVAESKYPPRGVRGFGFSRTNRYGADFHEAAAEANEEIAVIVQIEHKDAIADLDGILSVEGVDGAFIGPMDLSGSMGLTGQFDHPDVVAALDAFLAACRSHGVAAGMHIIRPTAQAVGDGVQCGYTLLALGLDVTLLHDAASICLAAARGEGTPG